jgi:single-stranded-DNA-specific exonuclease
MGEGKHLRFTVRNGGVRCTAVAFGVSSTRLPVPDDTPADATFELERNEWNGAVSPRLLLRDARPCAPDPIDVIGEPDDYVGTALRLAAGPIDHAAVEPAAAERGAGRTVVDHRGSGVAGVIADLVATGESVLVVCADIPTRLAGFRDRLGGFALTRHAALASAPELADGYRHVVVLDPPTTRPAEDRLTRGDGFVHFAWGEDEVEFARRVLHRDLDLRADLKTLYRALRDCPDASGETLERILRGNERNPRPVEVAGRLIRVLTDLGVVTLDRERRALGVPPAERTQLERSAAFRAYQQQLEDGLRFLSHPIKAQAA